jgi:ABC-type dipeptide/oligopeptide/nickel transport system permease subunit
MKNEIFKRLLSVLILLPVSFFLILKGSLYFSIFLSICLAISLLEWINLAQTVHSKILGAIFLFFSFLSAHVLRNLY